MKEYKYTNRQIVELIDDHIHNERNRGILKRRLVDGLTYDELAYEFKLDPRYIKTIVYKSMEILSEYL